MQRRKTNHFLIDFCTAFPSKFCLFIEGTIKSNHTMIIYKNSFYKNFSLVPSLPPKNINLALVLENWKKNQQSNFYTKTLFTWFYKLISNILWRITGLFLPLTADVLDFLVSLSTISTLVFLQTSYIIMRDFGTITLLWRMTLSYRNQSILFSV